MIEFKDLKLGCLRYKVKNDLWDKILEITKNDNESEVYFIKPFVDGDSINQFGIYAFVNDKVYIGKVIKGNNNEKMKYSIERYYFHEIQSLKITYCDYYIEMEFCIVGTTNRLSSEDDLNYTWGEKLTKIIERIAKKIDF